MEDEKENLHVGFKSVSNEQYFYKFSNFIDVIKGKNHHKVCGLDSDCTVHKT